MALVRVAVIGHVEHITLGFVPKVPAPGEIAHLEDLHVFAGGGGGVALFQLCHGPTEAHVFTALGKDEAGAFVRQRLLSSGARVHAAEREEPHTRDVVMVTPDRERTIVVLGQPLHPRHTDALPWELLAQMDAVYFTAEDPELLRRARAAKILVATARRRAAILASGIAPDVIVGSLHDERERSTLADYPHPPKALVLTEGAKGGAVYTASGTRRWLAEVVPDATGAAYGAGDSFAGALTGYLAAGFEVLQAAQKAARHGAAVLAGKEPIGAQVPLVF